MPQIELKNVAKTYGAVKVIHGVSMAIEKGEFTVFVGPSGCGKSTLLRMIAGLEEITGGDLFIGGAWMNEREPSERGVAMVFQSYALYPHMTVFDNMSFGLRMAKAPKAEIEAKVNNAASILQLTPLLQRKPAELSGGQRQRVAIGRAIVRNPDVFLFDEPLSNLDAELRVQTRVEIAKLHQTLGNTIVYVTHDQTEAMTLADKIVVLRAGLVEQIGSPVELYEDPDNEFVAGFIGSPRMNFVKAKVSADGARISAGGIDMDVPKLSTSLAAGTSLKLGIRPEHLDEAEGIALSATAEVIEQLGSTAYVHAALPSGETVIAERRRTQVKPGETVQFRFDPANARYFADDGKRLR
jgi:lactose/L-arabinose transport system ATP-binding protein